MDLLGFLSDGGAVGNLLLDGEWRDAPLGVPAQWSSSLKMLMGTVLTAQAQIVLFWGPAYVALYNDAYAPSIGAKHPAALGRPAVEHWTELWDDLEPLLRGVRETGKTFSAKDRPFYLERHGVGETTYFDVSYSAVREMDGAVGGVLCIVTETTEQVRAAAQLREMNEGLEQRVADMVAQRESEMAQLHEARKMEVIGQLTGGVAHDFNNMLTPIMGSMELLRRRLEDPRALGLVDNALQAADRARTLVGRLLAFARRQTLKPRAVALDELVDNMLELIQRSLGPAIDVTVDVPGRLPAVLVDPHQLELAILNLAVNARDAMGESGRLSILAHADSVASGVVGDLRAGEYVCLEVIDDGCGMDPATLERCVDPFFSTKGTGKGPGLGLSMVQGLAGQSGGGLAIVSEQGQGTSVRVWLPLSKKPVIDSTSPRQVRSAPVAPRSAHVLLVDDEDTVRRTTALQLQELGYRLSEARSAAEALRLIKNGLTPDVLVTDHLMPDRTGAQFARDARRHIPLLPVLIITGYANLTPAQLHGFEVLAKPFRCDELASSLARLVGSD